MKSDENGEIIDRLKNEKSISALFKNIISPNMITIISFYTNKRIGNITTANIESKDRREKIAKVKNIPVTIMELYAYIGLLILFGLGNNISVEFLWSQKSLVHYSPFASAALSRDRFQLFSRHICFDDVDTRPHP